MSSRAVAPPVPTLAGAPLLGSMRAMRRDYLGTISRAARELGGLARISAGPPGWRVTVFVVSSPALAAEVLAQPDRFRKDAPGYRELRAALGNGLLTSQDEARRRRQRRLLAPLFTPRRIADEYATVMIEEADRLVTRWQSLAATGRPALAYPEMVRVTAQVIGRVLFGTDVSRAVEQLVRFDRINNALLRRAVNPHPIPRRWPTPANRRLDTELHEVRRVVAEIVAARRAEPDRRRGDLLGLLLNTGDPAGHGRLDDDEIADQVLIFLLAGLETTAVTLACTLLQLALAPEWQESVRHELHQQCVGTVPETADVGGLVWTGRVLRESMRLYPAAHGMARRARRDETLGGFRVPSGSWLEVSPWGIHHSPHVWSDPDTFDPRRFDLPADELPGGHRYAWIPFGAGPHICIGMHLAMLEMRIVLGAVLRAFALDTPLTSIPVHAAITLQPTGGLPLELRAV